MPSYYSGDVVVHFVLDILRIATQRCHLPRDELFTLKRSVGIILWPAASTSTLYIDDSQALHYDFSWAFLRKKKDPSETFLLPFFINPPTGNSGGATRIGMRVYC